MAKVLALRISGIAKKLIKQGEIMVFAAQES